MIEDGYIAPNTLIKNPHDTIDYGNPNPHAAFYIEDEVGSIEWTIDGRLIPPNSALNYRGLHIHAYRSMCFVMGFTAPDKPFECLILAKDDDGPLAMPLKVIV